MLIGVSVQSEHIRGSVTSVLGMGRLSKMPQEAWNEFSKWQQMKGVLAHESHTSAWLVSPAAGCEKKNGGLHNRASDHQIGYSRTYFSIYK